MTKMDIDNFVEKSQYKREANVSWGSPTSSSYESYFKSIASTKPLKAESVTDILPEKTTFEDAMQEFKRNGSDSPYNPDEDRRWSFNDYTGNLVGMGPSSGFLRQRSWPEPERSSWVPSPHAKEFVPAAPATPIQPPPVTPVVEKTAEIVPSMPSLDNLEEMLYLLLRKLKLKCWEQTDIRRFNKQCRFCKNNGEREQYYLSHSLKDELGRVSCPVLRAFVCRRCGAKGDYAHTIKYCPFSTDEERLKSTAMLRSVRLASGRRRHNLPAPSPLDDCDYTSFHSEGLPSTVSVAPPPLDASWAALERKLMR